LFDFRTTVAAAAVALLHARAGHRTLLIDAADHHDTYAALGMPEPTDPTGPVTVTANLELRSTDPGTAPGTAPGDVDGYDVVIIDAGQHRPDTDTATLVTRACYLALRRAITITPPPDNAVLIQEPGRALDHDDVAAVLSVPIIAVVLSVPIIATIPTDPAVARVVDAGLLAARLPAALRHLRDAVTAPDNATT